MSARRIPALAALGAVALAALVPASAGAGAAAKRPVKKKVAVEDYFYAPARLTVPKGSTIIWRWPVVGGDSHDVTLGKGPKGVRKFQSEVATSEYVYRRKLTVPGKYHIVCTLHEEMTMDITVR